MADPMPPPSSPGAMSSNPPVWVPSGPPMMHRGSMMPMATFMLRLLGFTLLFVGTIIVVAFANPGGGCFTNATNPPCAPGTTFVSGAFNAIMVGQILWSIGLFAIGAGSGLKMHFGLQAPAGGTPESYRFIIMDRWFNGIVLLVTIVLLFVLLRGVPFLPAGI